MNTQRTLLVVALAAASLAAPLAAHAALVVDVNVAPPPPIYEKAEVREGYIYTPGYYQYDESRHQHTWVKGEYQKERHGEHWVAHQWTEKDGRYHLNEGRWETDQAK